MFENDYVMRLIREIVRAILKLLFDIDTDSPTSELMEDVEEKAMLNNLLKMIDDGKINEAENFIYDLSEDGNNKSNLKMALIFYSHLNEKSDEFLINNNFSREEVQNGLKSIVNKYGLDSISEMF